MTLFNMHCSFLISCLSPVPFLPSIFHLYCRLPLTHCMGVFSNLCLPHFLFLHYCSHPFLHPTFQIFPLSSTLITLDLFSSLFLFSSSPLSLLSLRCRMLWAMSCHGFILSLSSSSAPFSFSISFWGCWAGKSYAVVMCVPTVYVLFEVTM